MAEPCQDEGISQVTVRQYGSIPFRRLLGPVVMRAKEIDIRPGFVYGESRFQVFRFPDIVGVEKKHQVGIGHRQTGIEAGQLTLVILGHQPDPAVVRNQAADLLERAVIGTVVDQHDLVERNRLTHDSVKRFLHVSTVVVMIYQTAGLHRARF